MEGLTYLTLEYLTYLLLVLAAGGALFVCAVVFVGAAAPARAVAATWEAGVRPVIQVFWQHLTLRRAVVTVAYPGRRLSSASRQRR
jgi:hypothetical protein